MQEESKRKLETRMDDKNSIRRFPAETQVDAWIAAHIATTAAASPKWDQIIAATHDNGREFAGMAMHGVAGGQFRYAFIDRSGYSEYALRAAVRMYLAAESAGIKAMCAHVRQIRPLVLMCDPPTVTCRECLRLVAPKIKSLGFCWNQTCDRCGRYSPEVASAGQTLGHLTLIGHICMQCRNDDEEHDIQTADVVMRVGRNQPCPCGSGRKYKKCHERSRQSLRSRTTS